MFERVREVSSKARLFARAVHRTGAIGDLGPAGIMATARTVLKGATGPSAIFRIHGVDHPDRVALQFEGRQLKYAEVDQRIDRLSSALRRRGFRRGDGAVLMLKNRPECFEVGAAMSRLGGSGVAVSSHSTPAELAYLINHSGSRAIFFEAELWPVVELARREIAGIDDRSSFPVGGEIPGLTSVDEMIRERSDDALLATEQEGAVILYTSGTTGKPKGAVRRFARGQLEGWAGFIGETPMHVRDKHLCVCPLYHSTGLFFASVCLMLGGKVVLLREFDPATFLDTIEREGIQTTTLVPTMLHRVIAAADTQAARGDTRSLRAMFCGGAQLPPTLGSRALDRFGPILYNFYGSTETGLVTLATPDDLRASPGTIGRALPGCEIRLLDDTGSDVPDGAVGELFVRNSTLVDGYHADADATRSSMREGFFSVGDLATRDTAGRFHLVGRKRDVVISGGVNVYPVEVEQTIEAHPSVAQAAVIGVPDEEWGERLRAFVVLKTDHAISGDELRAFCRLKLSGAKVPREWVFPDALPMNPTGKILKRELRTHPGPIERV